jgi:diaminopimelate epimerase
MGSRALPFTKMQAVGNDFVVVEEAKWPADTDWNAAAIRLCDRHFGIGGDGLLVVGPSAVADIRMRMFNPDGTEDMCGNGLRCVAAFSADRGDLAISAAKGFLLESRMSVHKARRVETGKWAIGMGIPDFRPEAIPANLPGDRILDRPLTVGDETVVISSVSTGSTHTILFVDTLPSNARFLELSPRIENHPAFPERTSVIWAAPDEFIEAGPIPDAGIEGFNIRIWERGVGETMGCGTGACAVAVTAKATGRSSAAIVFVSSRGGTLGVDFLPGATNGEMVLIGPAEFVFDGHWHAED